MDWARSRFCLDCVRHSCRIAVNASTTSSNPNWGSSLTVVSGLGSWSNEVSFIRIINSFIRLDGIRLLSRVAEFFSSRFGDSGMLINENSKTKVSRFGDSRGFVAV